MGHVLKFKPRAEVPRHSVSPKLTGFLPPLVAKPPLALSHDPFVAVTTAILTIGFLPLLVLDVWFADGWRDR